MSGKKGSGAKGSAGKTSRGKAERSDDVETVVRRYYAALSDLGTPPKHLARLIGKKARITEHPNAISPEGATRDRQSTVEGHVSGREVLSAQSYDVHEVLVTGRRAAVRATWRGVLAVPAGSLEPGTELLAHVASFLTVRDGVVVLQETFDCYESF